MRQNFTDKAEILLDGYLAASQTTVYSAWYDVSKFDNLGIHIFATGTITGTVTVEISNEENELTVRYRANGGLMPREVTPQSTPITTLTHFVSLGNVQSFPSGLPNADGYSAAISGATEKFINIPYISCVWVRVKFVGTPGAGNTLSARVMGKHIGR